MNIDKNKVEEVRLYVDNDYNAYQILMNNYLPSLQKKVLAGKYNKELAIKSLVNYYTKILPIIAKPKALGYNPKLNKDEKIAFAKEIEEYLWDEFLKNLKKDIPKKNK